jgi:hypothetical protein
MVHSRGSSEVFKVQDLPFSSTKLSAVGIATGKEKNSMYGQRYNICGRCSVAI